MIDILPAILDEMARHRMTPAEPHRLRLDGVIARFDCDGDKKHTRKGWCVVHAGARPVAVFGHWSRDIQETCVLGSREPLTAAEREKLRNAMAQAQAAREAGLRRGHHLARKEANDQWTSAPPAADLHPYLVAKGINGAGARERNGFLLIPMRDKAGALWNVQRIRVDGQKRFLRGGMVKGCYCPLGGPVGDHVVVCEGWATGKSLQQSTGLPVAVSFSAGNLEAVAKLMRAKYPAARITVAADNDVKPDGSNPGVAAATAAALAVDGFLAVPPIAGDFNDYAALCGTDALPEVTPNDQLER